MEELIGGVRRAARDENWYAALGLSLALPDICGCVETPAAKSRERYVGWCTCYLVPKYTHPVGPAHEEHVFLSGEDCYALRCAFLHEGADDIVNQRARRALERFLFVAPRPRLTVHCNQSNSRLQLQVDIFCEDVCVAAEEWLSAVRGRDADIDSRLASLMKIESLEGGFSF